MDDQLRRFAEDPAAWGDDFPADSEWRRILTDRYCLLLGAIPSSTHVSRLRLDPDDVASTIAEVRSEVASGGHRGALWNVGSSASPSDLVDRLVAHGLKPEDHLTPLALTSEPEAGPPEIEARRVADFDEFLAARRITEDAFETPQDERDEWLPGAEERFAAERTDRGGRVYIAFIDGRPVASAACVVEQGLPAAVMIGGAVLPDTRGRGAYRALVRARWDDALAAGLSALTVQARHTSRPILERLGFEPAGEIEVLLDPATC